MTELDELKVTLQRQLDAQNARIDNMATKVDMFIAEAQQQREDMRQAQAKHDADMKEMRQKHDADMKEIRQKHDTDMKELREDIKSTLRHIQGLTIAAMVGIVAIAGATWAFMWLSTRATLPPTPPVQSTQIDQSRGN